MRHQLVEIRSSDLQFTAQEAGEFLHRVMKIDLPSAELETLPKADRGLGGWFDNWRPYPCATENSQARTGHGGVREWFRFHHLFADFLYKQVLTKYPAERIRTLHQRAARWLAEQRYVTEAIEHAPLRRTMNLPQR
ncbi:MAG: hypothetical protein IPO36_14655 [Anaerolineales bacterium]|nr:hypothetical protein [Anaerolineales bacterium]